MLHRKFIAAVVATSIAISSFAANAAQAGNARGYSAVPQQQSRQHNTAGNEALAPALAGAAALSIIGKTIENNRSPRTRAYHGGHRNDRRQFRHGRSHGPKHHRRHGPGRGHGRH